MRKKLKPVHPGEILREEFMKPLGLSMNRMAIDLRVPLTRIADIVVLFFCGAMTLATTRPSRIASVQKFKRSSDFPRVAA
jgi:hypothetical protein